MKVQAGWMWLLVTFALFCLWYSDCSFALPIGTKPPGKRANLENPSEEQINKVTEEHAKQWMLKYKVAKPGQSINLIHEISKIQQRAGINVTGKLDKATKRLFIIPRCGVAESEDEDQQHGGIINRRKKRYYLQGSSWQKKNLTYRFIFNTKDLPVDVQQNIIRTALKLWEAVSTLIIREETDPSVSDEKVDILISFPRRYHGDPYSFDGPGGTLAHAYYPHNNRGLSGDAHFDDDEEFTTGTSDGINLDWVAVHEFGHSLGLQHSNVRESIMYPWYKGYFPNIELTDDDIAGIQELYGKPTPTPVETTTETPTTQPETTTKSSTTETPTTQPETTTKSSTTETPTTQPETTTKSSTTETPTTKPDTTTKKSTTETPTTQPKSTTTETPTTQPKSTTTETPTTKPKSTTTETPTTKPDTTTKSSTETPTTQSKSTTTETPTTKPKSTTTETPTTKPETTTKSSTTETPTTQPKSTTTETPTTKPDTTTKSSTTETPTTKPDTTTKRSTTETPTTQPKSTTTVTPTTKPKSTTTETPTTKPDTTTKRSTAETPTTQSKSTTTETPTTKPETTTQSTTKATTETSTERPTTSLPGMDICKVVKFDSFVMGLDRKTYVFSGDYFWVLSDRLDVESGPTKITSKWKELSTPINSAYTNWDGRTVFFKGSQYWMYFGDRLEEGPRHINQYGLPSPLENMDAAFIWEKNYKAYFFKGLNYWRYNEFFHSMDPGYPKNISIWGLPHSMNSAMSWSGNRRTYFFRDEDYWKLDDRKLTLVSGYPRDITKIWMKCPT